MMIEFLVLFFGNFAARARPQSRRGVDRFFLAAVLEHDRQPDMVGIGPDDRLQPARVQIIVFALAQMHDDRRAAAETLMGLDRKFAFAVRDPAPALGLAGLAAQDFDLFGHHEGRVKTDTELTNKAHILLRVARHLVEKGGRPGAGDGAKIVDQFAAVHADAVIGNPKGASSCIGGQHDPIGAVAFGQARLGQRRITQPVAGIRRVRYQFAHEHFFLAVERVRDDIEKAAHFRLEASLFLGHRLRSQVLAERRGYVARRDAAQPPSANPICACVAAAASQ